MDKSRQVIRIAASLENLEPVRDFLKEQGETCGLSINATLDLITAVDEALTNIITHGYQNNARRSVEVEAKPGRGGLCVRLLDRAPAFNPLTFPRPNLDIPLHRRPPGGLGIFLMRQSVDEVSYRPRPGGGNILVLCKRA